MLDARNGKRAYIYISCDLAVLVGVNSRLEENFPESFFPKPYLLYNHEAKYYSPPSFLVFFARIGVVYGHVICDVGLF